MGIAVLNTSPSRLLPRSNRDIVFMDIVFMDIVFMDNVRAHKVAGVRGDRGAPARSCAISRPTRPISTSSRMPTPRSRRTCARPPPAPSFALEACRVQREGDCTFTRVSWTRLAQSGLRTQLNRVAVAEARVTTFDAVRCFR
jgi:hypothetical protein